MRSTVGLGSLSILATAIGCSGGPRGEAVATSAQALLAPSEDQAGVAASFHTSGSIDQTNPFFQPLGTNTRTCATCHDSSAGWTMTPQLAQQLFDESDGLADLFSAVDETVRPDSDISTLEARQTAFALLLTKGLTRFTRTVPSTAEFEVVSVDDPYGWSTPAAFSNFRRIIATANEAHASSVQWTGGPGDVRTRIAAIMVGGVRLHEQGMVPITPDVANAGADFLMGLSFAQEIDNSAGNLTVAGATGGPANVSSEPFYIGINALGGDSQTGAPFDNESMDMYEAWETSPDAARQQVGRGENAFYTVDVEITNVPGINDALGQPVVHGHCTTCHNTPNIGSHSEFRMIDLGLTGPELRSPDLPLVTLLNKTTGETRQTTDLGRALNSGLWTDVGRFKVPTLRGVGARAPYFHNGSAATLSDVLNFYENRFGVDFGGAQDDIIAFLQSL